MPVIIRDAVWRGKARFPRSWGLVLAAAALALAIAVPSVWMTVRAQSAPFTFGPVMSGVTQTEATVSWGIAEESSGWIDYCLVSTGECVRNYRSRTIANLASGEMGDVIGTDHSLTIINLKPGEEYVVTAYSTVKGGTVSRSLTFRTESGIGENPTVDPVVSAERETVMGTDAAAVRPETVTEPEPTAEPPPTETENRILGERPVMEVDSGPVPV
ncbi:hypothetical protein JW899_03840, partial [Candidatus Uhrbacteria bacterium]|nr:hypothetical protein [Candidatus Uhrbacteria bacterium]